MYIENTISAASNIAAKWNEGTFTSQRSKFSQGATQLKTVLSEKIVILYEELSLNERRFLIKINAYKLLVEAYDNAKSSGVTRSDLSILDNKLRQLSNFSTVAQNIGISAATSNADMENPSIEVTFPIESGTSNVLNAIDEIKRFFNVLNNQKKILGNTESDLTLELLENKKVKITFGTSLEYSLVIMEIWSSLSSKSSALKRINENIEGLRQEGISDGVLEAVAKEGADIVNKALDDANANLNELNLHTNDKWETEFYQLGNYLEARRSEGYEMKLILSSTIRMRFESEEDGLLGERALNLEKYSRDRDDAYILGSRKLIT